MDTLIRRRSPGWVRALDGRQLHAMGMRLRRMFREEGLSEPQDWLLGAVISELEYRARAARARRQDCLCELCCSPFPDIT